MANYSPRRHVEYAARMKGIGERVKNLRKGMGLSQDSLSKEAGVHQAALSRLEAGAKVDFSIHSFANIARVTQVPMAWLYWGEEEEA